MNTVISCFLWLYIINHEKSQGGAAASYTSGFPSRLIYNVSLRAGPHIRLIPEMNFVCNGTITGYTAVLRHRTLPGDQLQGPKIQIWRKNFTRASQFGSYVYYKTSPDIAIDSALCVDGLTQVSSAHGVFHCNLNQSTRVSVQAGEILGLELPSKDNDDIRLAFARVSSGPTNFVFDTRESQISYYCDLWRRNWIAWELPQITLEIGSDSNCIRGFPDVPVSAVGRRTVATNMTTLLIPEMNFTCNASVVGFIVSGRFLPDDDLHPRVQIWHKSSESYYQVESISIHGGACVAMQEIVGDTYLCILHDNFRVSVQPEDILGLELPATDSDKILFINRGPTNYIFRHSNQLDSNTNLSLNGRATAQQLPQIIFNLTSAHCLSGFPEAIDGRVELSQSDRLQLTTRLFPELKFGCFGTIVRVTVAVWDSRDGDKDPKIQIWREDKTIPGLYHKISSVIQIRQSNPQCDDNQRTIMNDILQCTLRKDLRIPVQPGDFLGLEIPSYIEDDLVIYFKTGGPTNLIFQGQLGSTVDLFSESHTITNCEPQVTFLVVLDEGRNLCPSADIISTTAGLTTTFTTKAVTSTAAVSKESTTVGSSVSETIIGTIGGVIAILLLVGITLLVAVLVQRRHRKQYNIKESDSRTYPNPVYDGTSYNRGLPTKKLEASYKDDTPTNYDHIKFNVKRNEAVSLHTKDQNCNATYETLETHYEMTGPTLATNAEPYIYWEPANTVNDLHKQLSSNKYRELLRQQVKITKALGSGQFGVVSMGVWQSPMGAMEVAVKQLQPGVTEAEKIRFLQEAAINGQFRHPNVVQLMGVVTTGEPAMIVLELLSNGDLRNFLIKHQTSQKHESGEVDNHLLLRFCQHIASGMSYLASKAFVHRDLAARNILVSKDNICKISDFGMSRDLLDEDYYVSRGGMVPVKWTAPEAIHYKKYSTASDVWSFGCVMYEIWSLGHKPFESYNNAEVIKMIDKGYRLPPPPGLTKELYKIMIQCWQPERSLRPTFPQLVELLSRADFELFLWEEEDLRGSNDPRVREIGAPLEIATGLYPDLQKTYLGKK